MAGRIERAGVRNRLVNRNYLKGTFTPDRMADVRRAVAAEGPVNEDFNPILYYYHLRYWMSQFQAGFGLFEGVLLLVLAVYMVRLRPVALAVFCGGLAASALEIVLLLSLSDRLRIALLRGRGDRHDVHGRVGPRRGARRPRSM